jgi:hemerythrin-like domain-containing protein
MTQPGGAPPRPDTTDMIALHGVFRDTLRAAPELVGAVADGDAARRALIANYYENVLSLLETHHQGEDELVYPLLSERCPDQAELINRLTAQHGDALAYVAAARASLTAWPAGDATAQAEVLTALEALREDLEVHLVDEEENGLPLAADHLSPEEWGALPAHGMATFDGDKIWLILGLIRERMNEGQRANMLAHMPPPAVEMWTGFGEDAFHELSSEIVVEVRHRVL